MRKSDFLGVFWGMELKQTIMAAVRTGRDRCATEMHSVIGCLVAIICVGGDARIGWHLGWLAAALISLVLNIGSDVLRGFEMRHYSMHVSDVMCSTVFE